MGRNYAIDDFFTFAITIHDPVTGADKEADLGGEPVGFIFEDRANTPLLFRECLITAPLFLTAYYTERITLLASSGFEGGKDYFVIYVATVDGVESASLPQYFQIDTPVVVESFSIAALASIFDFVAEGTQTFKGILRYLLSYVGGKTSDTNTDNPKYLSQDDNVIRITGTSNAAGDRTDVVLDDSD